ncbi:nucleotidyltransferase family protein [Methanobacterium sp.]|uniref:nucleotidyltransferase domain-containing protein n=1 Tax=Methanobacterium sp. TaxID=2164 RepID=UPI0025CE90E4|nr:nucleotidyltransferase family protein [Methanobacterium sp.]MBI5459250.1 nucleotidyltransferase family protein [Methanobacterium sp.]
MARKYDLKPEDQLLLNCSLTQASEGNVKKIKQLSAMNLDWDYLINMAYLHRISPLLYWHLNKISPDAIPSNLKMELQKHFHKNVRKNLGMFKELLEVIDVLQKQGITPIPYKGPALAIMTYKNLGFRIFGDLDFYVPLKDVPKTRNHLVKAGYELWMNLTPEQEMAFYKFQREYHFTNKKTGITLEIKWKLLSMVSIQNKPFFNKNEFLREVDLDQFKVKTISPEYLILILSIHNATHSFSSLYRFCDISELIKSEDKINWQNLLEIASDLGVQRIFMINLYILKELFGIKPSKEVLEQINNEDVEIISVIIIKRLFTPKTLGMLEKVIFHMKIREKRGDKINTMLNMIFLPTPGVISSVSVPRVFEPLYYILRVFQMLKNIIHL